MKKLKNLFAKDPTTGRRNKKVLFLSIVALVEVILIMVVSTSAWIETVSSIKIYTTTLDPKPEISSGGTKGVIETHLNQQVNVNDASTVTNSIDLSGYFRKSGGYHLAPCSSADGDNFYFPENRGGSATNFRYGDISDKNVNYVSFTVKVKSANYFAFKRVPTVKIGGTTISNDLVRFSIGYRKNATAQSDFKVFGMTEDTTAVVNSADGSTGPTYVRAFSDYITGKNNLVCTTAANSFLTISMWIQDPAFASYSTYNNKAVTVENLELVPVHEFKLYAVTNNNDPTAAANQNLRGGTVAIGDGDFGRVATGYFAYNTPITIKANPNVSNLFQFTGWATAYNGTPTIAASSCTKSGNMYSYTYTFTSSQSTLYAKFTDLHELYFKPLFAHPDIPTNANGTYLMYIWQWDPATQTTKKEWHAMRYVSSGTWSGYYKGEYNGNSTNVIFCYMNPNYRYNDGTYTIGQSGKTTITLSNYTEKQIFDNYKWLQTYDLVFPPELGEYSYVATSRYTESSSGTPAFATSYVMGFWEDCYARVYAQAAAGGTVTDAYLTNSTTSQNSLTRFPSPRTVENSKYYVNLDGRSYDGNVNGTSVANHYDRRVTLVAAPDSSHNFDGWYLNGTRVSTSATFTTAQAPENSTTRGTKSNPSVSSVTYEARFKAKPSKTINVYITPRQNWSEYWLKVRTSGGTEITNTKATYDNNTGYYKVSFTTQLDSTALQWSLDGGANYAALLTTGTTSTTYNKRIDRSGGVTDKGNYRCWWFTDNTSTKWIKNDWDRTNDQKSRMVLYTSSNAEMLRQDDYSWICETSSFTSGTLYFKEIPTNQGTNGTIWNQWKASYSSTASQCKATSGGTNVSVTLS